MHGIVKWFDARKGFGFITDEEGRDYFVHQSNIQMEGFRKLVREQEVSFEADTDDNGRDVALKRHSSVTQFAELKKEAGIGSYNQSRLLLIFRFFLSLFCCSVPAPS